MPALQRVLFAVQQDPVFAYSLMAAAFLALVSVLTGLLRRDVAVLVRPRILLRVLVAVLLAYGIDLAATKLAGVAGASAWGPLVAGFERFPLAIVALAYGPVVGLAVAGLAVILQAHGLPSWPQAVFVLELAVLGWLAIYPSPRSTRWAGPFNAVLAYLLAWGTGGLALLSAAHPSVSLSMLWTQQHAVVPGVLASSALLALVTPSMYRRAFPRSRIEPPVSGPVPTSPIGVSGRDPMKLTYPDLPRVEIRRDRVRQLDPLPGFLVDDTEAG